MYAEIAFPIPLRKNFVYGIPVGMEEDCIPGKRVLCPFGNKEEIGFVVGLSENRGGYRGRVKDVSDILDDEPLLSGDMLSFTKWAADYYLVSWGEVIRASLPAAVQLKKVKKLKFNKAPEGELTTLQRKAVNFIKDKKSVTPERIAKELDVGNINHLIGKLADEGIVKIDSGVDEKVHPRFRLAYKLADGDPDEMKRKVQSAPQQRKALEFMLSEEREMLAAELDHILPSPHSVLKAMEKKGVVKGRYKRISRTPRWDKELDPPEEVVLTSEQKTVLRSLLPVLEEGGGFKPVLLGGVTGSGKTEIYIRLIRKALELGKSALYLVPEIALTPQTLKRLSAYMYSEIAVLHSGLSEGERADEWERIKKGRASLVVGTRSAIFAPAENIGVIVIDEEHDASFKQDESPYYNARDLALKRGRDEGALVVLGSATPSMESYHNALGGKYELHKLTRRVEDRPLPVPAVIDMRREYKERHKQVPLSRSLESELYGVLNRGEQAIVLLNRRGYSANLVCSECGNVEDCPDCSVSLTYHKSLDRLKCHYCGYMKKPDWKCSKCGKKMIDLKGWGTQQIEEILKDLFNGVRLLRMDRDTTRTKDAYYRMLNKFDRGEADILLGTQMVAKGHDFPGVTLVGIISADTGLGFPDFRAGERTFQLISQVAGRAGRGEKPGKVLVQTLYPDNYSIRAACDVDYESFYNREIKYRELMKYPPATAVASIIVREKSGEKAGEKARKAAGILRNLSDPYCRVLGPSEAPIFRTRNLYRYLIVFKSSSRGRLREKLGEFQKQTGPSEVRIDLDPYNLL